MRGSDKVEVTVEELVCLRFYAVVEGDDEPVGVDRAKATDGLARTMIAVACSGSGSTVAASTICSHAGCDAVML